jgi:hypothetical protein
MTTVHEPARDVPVAAECDLCVIGGSCTGVFAAVRAARLGAKVVLLENNGFFGGAATAGLVNVWHSDYDTARQRPILAGLTDEVIERLRARDAVHGGDPEAHPNYILNTAELTIELDKLVAEAGVRPFLHARFAAPVLDDGRVVAAIFEDKTGRRAVRARAFIDATGDGDLVARMGLPFRLDPELQPPTTCVILRGLSKVKERNRGFRLNDAAFDDRYPEALPPGFLWSAMAVGSDEEVMVAGTRVSGANCADADDLTRAEIEGRRQVRALCDVVRNHFEAGEAVSPVALPAYIGIRETRHAECLHTLTESEVLHGTRFPDAIANGSYPVDIHHSDKPGITFRYLDGSERYVPPRGEVSPGRWRERSEENPTFYQIPYRSLIPKGTSNVLVAGRLVGVDKGAYGAIRVMINCNQTGEAAGVGAALALDADVPPVEVDAEALRETLAEGGSLVI